MKIGIISDTHGLLRPQVLERLKNCQAILHAGDFSSPEVLEALDGLAPLYAVRGNTDGEWAGILPWSQEFTLDGVIFYMTHKKRDLPGDLSAYDAVICGHSHVYDQVLSEGTLFLNPGSCGPRRFGRPATMAEMIISRGKIKKVERIDLPSEAGEALKIEATFKDRMDLTGAMIRKAMDMVARGRSVREVSEKLAIGEDLSEEICRMILTHPGVTPEGVLRRLGL